MDIKIIKYNAGNVQSVIFALERLGVTPVLTDSTEELLKADKIIFPGVGDAYACMLSLKKTGLDAWIPQFKQPLLGICVGMQLLCKHTEEGNTTGLGVFNTMVRKFKVTYQLEYGICKVPHMGWNTLTDIQGKIFKGINANEFVYFVHSYGADLCSYTSAKTQYTSAFSAALEKDNFHAVQFHPEKSGEIGSKILSNFLNL